MRFQDFIVKATRSAAEESFRYASAIPSDKLDWKPLDSGRSAIDIARELAMCPTWAYDMIANKETPEWSEESMKEQQSVMNGWRTIEDCKAQLDERLGTLIALCCDFPDERLSETKWLPYDGGRDFTIEEIMEYPRWNFIYHTGQLAYIQTLYGDKEMH